jgi:hypothetical protein
METIRMKQNLILFLILPMLLFSIGCNKPDKSSTEDSIYKTCSTWDKDYSYFKVKEHPDFTFEYPGSFKLIWPGWSTPGFTEYCFVRDTDNFFLHSTICLFVAEPGDKGTPVDTKSAIDSFLTGPSDKNGYDNYSVIERKSMLVDNIEAESATILINGMKEVNNPPWDAIDRKVIFEYKGLLWRFGIICGANEESNIMPYFDHLLETFRIVENPPTTK